jgi:phage terminase large subunit-like protein
MNLSEVSELAQLLNGQPELAGILEAENPNEFREFWRMAAIPAMRFEPFKGVKGNQAQVGSHSSNHHNKWDVCGNRTGKTLRGLNEDWCDQMLLDPMTKGISKRFTEPFPMWIVSDTEETSIDVIEKTFAEEVLGLDEQGMGWQLVKDGTTWNRKAGFSNHLCEFTNGSTIRFKFSTQKRRTFQGVSLGKAHLDEEQPYDVYGECRTRLVDRHGYLLGTMTPIYERSKGISWVYEELYLDRNNKDIEFHNWSLLDNPYITDQAKKTLMKEWNEDDIEARVYGMFVPMGVKLAFSGALIREIEAGCVSGIDGQIDMNEHGQIVFSRDAA